MLTIGRVIISKLSRLRLDRKPGSPTHAGAPLDPKRSGFRLRRLGHADTATVDFDPFLGSPSAVPALVTRLR